VFSTNQCRLFALRQHLAAFRSRSVQLPRPALRALVARSCTARPDRAPHLSSAASPSPDPLRRLRVCPNTFGWDPLLPQASYRVGEGVVEYRTSPGTLGYSSYSPPWLLLMSRIPKLLAQLNLETRPRMASYRRGQRVGLAGRHGAHRHAAPRSWEWPPAAPPGSGGAGFRIPRRAPSRRWRSPPSPSDFTSPHWTALRTRTRWFIRRVLGRRPSPALGRQLWMALNHPLVASPRSLSRPVPHYESQSPRGSLSRFRPRIPAQYLPRRNGRARPSGLPDY